MKPLFIPLRRQYFEEFAAGEKIVEFRPYGPRWNERTCVVGRPVVLSLGYGKRHRLKGVVAGFHTNDLIAQQSDAWRSIYGTRHKTAACIRIKVENIKPVEGK